MATGALIALGGAAVAGGVLSYLGTRGQAKTAEKAAQRSYEEGQRGVGRIGSAGDIARTDLQTGARAGRGQLEAGTRVLGAQLGRTQDIFQQERDVGSTALDRLQGLLTGEGQAAALADDPGYQFRLAEGNKAIARAARAAGSFGGGANLKDFARFSQGLASEELDNITNRLMGLAGIGASANRSTAAIEAGLAGNIATSRADQANLETGIGSQLAGLGMDTAIAQTNAALGGTTQANNFAIQGANARAAGYGAIGGTINNLAMLGVLANQGGGTSVPQSPVYSL